MEIRTPTAQIGMTAGRGLAYNREAYDARPGRFEVADVTAIIAVIEGVPLKAGEETPVPVAVDRLAPNANVQRITATLRVISGSAENSTPVSVKEDGGKPRKFEVGVDAAPGLRNVQVRLQGG